MPAFDRRHFIGTSIGTLAAALAGPAHCADDLFRKQDPQPTLGKPSAPNTLFLTWQKDPTTTITIQWIAPDAARIAPIRYMPVGGEEWQARNVVTKPFPDTPLKVYRCDLTGLLAGTEYQFQIGRLAPLYRFRTMPAKATNTLQFVSGGDCGVNTHAIGTNILAARQEPHFALLGGDLAYDNGRSPDTFLAFLKNYSQHMVDSKKRLIPMVSCIGNHEVAGGFKQKRSAGPQYLSVFDGLFPEKTYGVLDIGDYLSLVLMDTDHIEPIGGAQTDWLAKTLAARQERPHLIVANHVPAYPSYRPPVGQNGSLGTGEEQRKYWCPLFERYNVDVVLEHHDHTFKRTYPLTNGLKDKNGVLYLGDGSWGQLRALNEKENRPYLAAVASAYHMTVHRLEGKQRFHIALEESGKVADVSMSTGKRVARRG